jgi:membrane protease subunit (stomatin/prohibitin family)
MRKSIKALAIASAVIAGLAVAPALYAHDSEESGDSMMGSGMMGMMNMMGQMSEMMEGCNRMMQSMSHDGSGRPNEQWRDKSPHNNGAPGTNG